MDSINLIGADVVRVAGESIASSADTIYQAADNMRNSADVVYDAMSSFNNGISNMNDLLNKHMLHFEHILSNKNNEIAIKANEENYDVCLFANQKEKLKEAIVLLKLCCGLQEHEFCYEELHNKVLSFVMDNEKNKENL